MNRFPAASTATPTGLFNLADVADPLSPAKPTVPVPATEVMICVVALTSRIRLFSRSAINRFPAASTATPLGPFNCADVAAPASPVKPAVPFPATVMIKCDDASTRRTRLLPESAINRFPAMSMAMALGLLNFANVAGPLSPENPAVPSPATVVIT